MDINNLDIKKLLAQKNGQNQPQITDKLTKAPDALFYANERDNIMSQEMINALNLLPNENLKSKNNAVNNFKIT